MELSSVSSASVFSSGSVATVDSSFCSVIVVSTGMEFCSGGFVSVESAAASALFCKIFFDSSTGFKVPSSRTESSLLTVSFESDVRTAS